MRLRNRWMVCGLASWTALSVTPRNRKRWMRRRACRMTHDSGIILGFENTISAKDNLAILEAVDSPALKIWYDIGNSTNIGHFNVPEEIRLLRRERICAFHIKDKGYLDTGAV